MSGQITKEKFIEKYTKNSGLTVEQFDEKLVALPCNCGVEGCQDWAAVANNELSIKVHNDLYGDDNE